MARLNRKVQEHRKEQHHDQGKQKLKASVSKKRVGNITIVLFVRHRVSVPEVVDATGYLIKRLIVSSFFDRGEFLFEQFRFLREPDPSAYVGKMSISFRWIDTRKPADLGHALGTCVDRVTVGFSQMI